MLNETDLSKLDLNLLVLFEAVVTERHVSRAASRLHISASAVSHGLGRLRRTFNDPLFLKHPKGVVPTARALEMIEPVAQILAGVRRVVANADPFDANRSSRRFIIGAPDALSVVMLPGVLRAVSERAPGVTMSVRDMLPADLVPALDARQIDVALYPLDVVPARFEAKLLYQEDFIIAARAGHALGKRPSLKKYCAAQHVLVSHSGDARGFVDEALERRGCSRAVALTVPSFMFALATISATNFIGTLPRNLLRMHGARFGIAMIEPPIPFGRYAVRAMAPKVALMDGGIAWLMDLLQNVLPQQSSGVKRRR